MIESVAYRDLVARADGKEILAYLIRNGVLARPRCFDDDCGKDAAREQPVFFWPILGTGSADLLESRQFGRRGQCFHFMADPPDWRKSPRDPSSGATVAMTRTAYERCLRLITSLFEETVHDPYTATIRGRGAYSLLHAIADSYSRAHVEREGDGAGKIRFLKVWMLRVWLVSPWAAFHPARRLHHSIIDSRDRDHIVADRVVSGRRCGDIVAAYEVPPQCLSIEGRAAADATADALVTLYTAMRGDPGAWRGFLERRMASVSAPLIVEKQHDDEHDWQPNLMIAARFRPDFGDDEWELGMTVAAMKVSRRTLPLMPLEAVTLGYARVGGVGMAAGRAEMSFLIPIWDRLGVGLAPVVGTLMCATGPFECHGDLLTQTVRLSFFSDLGIWIDVGGPEFSWIDRVWLDRVAFTAGVAFDIVGKLTGHRPSRPDKSPPPWDPPELQGDLLERSPNAFAFFVAGDLVSSDDDHLVGVGVEVRRERDRHNRRAGLGLGVELAYERGRINGDRLDDGRLIPWASYFLVPGFLSLRVSPLAFSMGKREDDLYVDLGAAAQLSVSISAVEVALSGPRFSYVHRDDNQLFPVSLRFTWRP